MGSHHPIRKTVAPGSPQIPDKLYFRIGDVARLCEVPAYVLRFWESEFPQLKPSKGGTGQRLYRRKDVEMALRIKSLLYDQGYTIAGARQIFKSEGPRSETDRPALEVSPTSAPATAHPAPAVDMGEQIRQRSQQQDRLRELRSEMLSLMELLGGRPNAAPSTPALPHKSDRPRPRLVLEPKPAPRSEPRLRLEKREDRAEDQRALFLFDVAEPAESASPVEMAE
jgi:DNA-binding transcriptional MerR regulator